MEISKFSKKKLWIGAAVVAAIGLGWYAWSRMADDGPGDGFVSGNGRIEATEVDVSTKLAGRVAEILVSEGDFVKAGQVLARMQTDTLEAQRDEAVAGRQEALHGVVAAKAQIALRVSDVAAAEAHLVQREAELDAEQRRLARSATLSKEGAASMQELDDNRARERSAAAAVNAAKAQILAARAAVEAAKAQETGASSRVAAADAAIRRIAAELADSELKASRDGRVQVRVAQPGEVLAGGGRVLSLVDLSDVYMTFFIPEVAAGRVGLGSEVRLIIDAAPERAIPAKVSFVAATAQFTPKTVETASERQKLMFRVKAQIAPDLLRKHIQLVKTGVPGVAWLKLDPAQPWPDKLPVERAE